MTPSRRNGGRRHRKAAPDAREYLFRETALDRASFLRDFLPAISLVAVALGLSLWLPVEADTGLRPVASSALLIVGTLAATWWTIARRLSRLRRRALGISPDAIRIYPPRGPPALPGSAPAPGTTIPRSEVLAIEAAPMKSIGSRLIRKRAGIALSEYRVQTRARVHRFDDLTWSADIDTMTRLERDAAPDGARRRFGCLLGAALEQAGYPVSPELARRAARFRNR